MTGYSEVNCRNQALAQACAVCSPTSGSMSEIEIFPQRLSEFASPQKFRRNSLIPRVDFEVKTAPAFDSHHALTFRVGKDGRCQTTSLMVYSVPTKYEFLYDTPAGLQPVRDDFVDHEINAGGVTARSEDPHYGIAWYFFVGPRAYRNQHPPSEFTSHSSPLPTPGPLSLHMP